MGWHIQFSGPRDSTAPSIPQGVTAVALDSASIRISWSPAADQAPAPVSGLYGYRLQRRTDPGGTFAFLVNTIGPGTTYTDTTLQPSTQYTYKVRAIDQAGNPGVFSSTVSATTSAGPPPATRRANVGHWVDVPRFEQENFGVDQAAVAAGIAFTGPTQAGVPRTGVVYSTSGNGNTAGGSPSYPTTDRLNIAGVQGVIMRYRWRELETTQGTYTFTRVTNELAQCLAIGNARGTRFGFIIFIEVNSFDGTNPLPTYLQSFSTTVAQRSQTWRWNSTIRTRFAALVQALATAFDSHACWDGIAVSETASDTASSDATSSYTPEDYRDALIAESDAIAAACTNGRHFFYQNFLPSHNGYLDTVVEAGIANGAMVMCGPDILPGKTSLENNVYPRFATYNGSLPMQCSAQNDSHNWNSTLKDTGVAPYDSMTTIFNYGRNTLKLNFMAWTWRRSGAGNHFDDDALVIAATPSWQPSPGWAP